MGHVLASAADLMVRVRKIAGQVSSVENALASDEPCATVLHRVAAVRGAVNGLVDEIIAAHLESHVANPDLTIEQRAAGAADLMTVIRRYSK